MPKLISINVGLPREVQWQGKSVTTSIFKAPVPGRVRVNRLNLAGDQQSDLTVHGGPDKAVYAYPSDHYEFWREQLPEADPSWAAFGENFTTEGLLENEIGIGDQLRIGTAEFLVTQPRMPCYKLAIRFDRADMVKRFLQAGRPGFYLRVLKEGDVGTGDAVTFISRDEHGISVTDIANLRTAASPNPALLRRASELPALPESWRNYFRRNLGDPDEREL